MKKILEIKLEHGICPYCGKPVIESREIVPVSKEDGVYDDYDRLWHLGCVEKAGDEALKKYGPEKMEETA